MKKDALLQVLGTPRAPRACSARHIGRDRFDTTDALAEGFGRDRHGSTGMLAAAHGQIINLFSMPWYLNYIKESYNSSDFSLL